MKTNSLVNPELNILSIQVSLDGFSFYIHDDSSANSPLSKQFPFKNVHTAEHALIEIQKIFDHTQILHNNFKKVVVIYANELFTIVPKHLFDSKNLTDYLKFNTKILKTDFIVYDELETLGLINVYVPYTNINNFFFDHFGTFTYYHSQTVLIKNILERATNLDSATFFVQVGLKTIDVLVYEGKKLLLSNHFRFDTDIDFVYYILFCFEQLGLNPEETTLKISGNINAEDSKYLILYDYVRNVQIAESVEQDQLNYSFLKYNLNL
ncbi:DUF3822 family protein [Leeuwenhoekiella sp. MAR_2009_132]|uniref:DUF3822 family protein n=1 Tax=Leeuwenhoekiella sp. MAR_2009_132 TaxID=1392489 RepID=UPI00068DCF84|nr:DUF3822 family protein [Leeuwenhoekiella sp. MAR_2009_132]